MNVLGRYRRTLCSPIALKTLSLRRQHPVTALLVFSFPYLIATYTSNQRD